MSTKLLATLRVGAIFFAISLVFGIYQEAYTSQSSMATLLNEEQEKTKSSSIVKGMVEPGKKQARSLGYPTANITLSSPEREGVHACQVFLKALKYKGMAYVDLKRHIIEVHLFDYEGDLYGQELEIHFSKFIRHPINFSSLNQVKTQLDQDAEDCLRDED